ncbi:2-oxoacid:acceptor oxidoreductase subunit alpha [Nitrospira sp. Kam-Ns4a]
MAAERTESRAEAAVAFVGSGGTGVMTAGELLLSTAASCGLYGILTKSFGPQIRGGESACFVRLGSVPFQKQADDLDVVIAFDWRNVERFQEELRLRPGAWILYEETQGEPPAALAAQAARCLPMAWNALTASAGRGTGHPNILVLGMVGFLLGLHQTAALDAITKRLGIRGAGLEGEAPAAAMELLHTGRRWAEQTWATPPFPLSAPPQASRRWVITGNQAVVIGSLRAGCEFYAGYPITPATDIMEELSEQLPARGGIVIQAEDELAAIAMAIGASFAGKKAMTGTSGPGFSLMAEGLGLAVMAEIPLVVVNVQRGGPSTGLPTWTEQGDLWAALASSHGDNPRIVLAPSSIRSCIELTVSAFNLAERYQVPVILLSDQYLGGRTEIVDPVALEALPVEHRRWAQAAEAGGFRRFGAPPAEPVAPIPLPGTPGTEYTADGLEHDERGAPDTSPLTHRSQAERRVRKLAPLEREEGWIEQCGDPGARVGLIGWGSTGGVVREAVQIAQRRGLSLKGFIPHLLFPVQPARLNPLLRPLRTLYVVELSSLRQFYRYLRTWYDLPGHVVPIARPGGLPFRTSEVLAALALPERRSAVAAPPGQPPPLDAG